MDGRTGVRTEGRTVKKPTTQFDPSGRVWSGLVGSGRIWSGLVGTPPPGEENLLVGSGRIWSLEVPDQHHLFQRLSSQPKMPMETPTWDPNPWVHLWAFYRHTSMCAYICLFTILMRAMVFK